VRTFKTFRSDILTDHSEVVVLVVQLSGPLNNESFRYDLLRKE
jgi:hypothetical protein